RCAKVPRIPIGNAVDKRSSFGEATKARFGPFELDCRAGDLRRGGRTIRLREQSFQILLMLLKQPGEVVFRDEIRKRLWQNDTTVEFDHRINAAIKKLRDALGESAEQPRYVETVARRGYRFIGEVVVDRSYPAEPRGETETPGDVTEFHVPDPFVGKTI